MSALQVDVPHQIDATLQEHLAICSDTRFLAALLFARLVTLTVFLGTENATPADEGRREISITHAGATALFSNWSSAPSRCRLSSTLTTQHSFFAHWQQRWAA